MFPPEQDNPVGGDVKDAGGETSDVVKTATVVSHTPSIAHPDENEPAELLTNDIMVDKGKRQLSWWLSLLS